MTKPPSFSDYIANLIDKSDKMQKEIAAELGYDRPNLITMFKQGATRVPLEKVPLLAKSLGIDPAHLARMALREYMPQVLQAIESVLGHIVTRNEMEIVEAIRAASRHTDPKLATKEQREQIKKLFG